MCREHPGIGRRSQGVVHEIWVVGGGQYPDGEEDDDESRLGETPDPGRSTRPEAAVRAGRVESGECCDEACKGEDEGPADQVGEEGERQGLLVMTGTMTETVR